MTDSESDDDAALLAEEQRIRAEYGITDDPIADDDYFQQPQPPEADVDNANDDVASTAIGAELDRLNREFQHLQSERDLLRQQVGKFEDLFQAIKPVEGADPAKFMETIMVDGREVVQDYRDEKIRDLARTCKSLNVKVNALSEGNDNKIKELAATKLQTDKYQKKLDRAARQHARRSQNDTENSPRQQKMQKMQLLMQHQKQSLSEQP